MNVNLASTKVDAHSVERISMEISMWMFLVIAVVMAIVVGRTGTLLRIICSYN